MIQIIVKDKSLTDIIGIIHELKSRGYTQGIDYDFSYYQTRWDDMIGEIPKHIIFTFYKDELATWFELSYK